MPERSWWQLEGWLSLQHEGRVIDSEGGRPVRGRFGSAWGILQSTPIRSTGLEGWKAPRELASHIGHEEIADIFVSKTGRAYPVVALVRAEFFGTRNPTGRVNSKQEVQREMETEFGYVAFELTLAEETNPANASTRPQQD